VCSTHKTKEDITSRVLTRILLEYEPVNLEMFSIELLTQAIRVNDRLLKDFANVYFRQAFEAFTGSQKQVDEMLRQAHHLTSAAASSTATLPRPWLPASALVPSARAGSSARNRDLASAAVQSEIAMLREEIAKLKAESTRRRTPTRKKKAGQH
jgi:uncharacterized small protein (DUF1192 family)